MVQKLRGRVLRCKCVFLPTYLTLAAYGIDAERKPFSQHAPAEMPALLPRRHVRDRQLVVRAPVRDARPVPGLQPQFLAGAGLLLRRDVHLVRPDRVLQPGLRRRHAAAARLDAARDLLRARADRSGEFRVHVPGFTRDVDLR